MSPAGGRRAERPGKACAEVRNTRVPERAPRVPRAHLGSRVGGHGRRRRGRRPAWARLANAGEAGVAESVGLGGGAVLVDQSAAGGVSTDCDSRFDPFDVTRSRLLADEGSVWAMLVGVREVVLQQRSELQLVSHDGAVEGSSWQTERPPLGVGVGSGCAWRGGEHIGADGEPHLPVELHHEEVPGLLGGPWPVPLVERTNADHDGLVRAGVGWRPASRRILPTGEAATVAESEDLRVPPVTAGEQEAEPATTRRTTIGSDPNTTTNPTRPGPRP